MLRFSARDSAMSVFKVHVHVHCMYITAVLRSVRVTASCNEYALVSLRVGVVDSDSAL